MLKSVRQQNRKQRPRERPQSCQQFNKNVNIPLYQIMYNVSMNNDKITLTLVVYTSHDKVVSFHQSAKKEVNSNSQL